VKEGNLVPPLQHDGNQHDRLIPQRGGAEVWIQQKIERFRRGMNEHMCMNDQIHRAALAIFNRDAQATAGSHSLKQKPVVVPVSERCDVGRVKVHRILLL